MICRFVSVVITSCFLLALAGAQAAELRLSVSAQAFRQQWNGVVADLAKAGNAAQAAQINTALLLGEISAVPLDSAGAAARWRVVTGDGTRITFSAETPQQNLSALQIETPAVGIYTGPARIAPGVAWSMWILQSGRTPEQTQALAVKLMRGASAPGMHSEVGRWRCDLSAWY